jgi:protein SCO1/2
VANRRSILFIGIIAVAAAFGGAMLARRVSQGPVALQNGTLLPKGRAIVDFSLTDHEGQPFGNAQLLRHPSLLFFGFTHCPDVCPTTLALLAQLARQKPIADLRLLFVTVDPERDDTLTLKRYVDAFSPQLVGLRGSDAELDKLMKSVGAARFRQQLADGNYLVDHSATLYLLDSGGRLVAVFTPPFSLPLLDADLRLASREMDL